MNLVLRHQILQLRPHAAAPSIAQASWAAFPLRGYTSAAGAEPAKKAAPFSINLGNPDEILSAEAMKPQQIVAALDRFIVGQADAKRAVAIAMRNRWRRQQVPSPLKEEIVPKNILMIGPTGVGKTEIARRMAKLANAPFIKVEATKFTEVGFVGKDVDQIIRDLVDSAITSTKFTEVGFVGKDVDQIIRDLVDSAITSTKSRLVAKFKAEIEIEVEERILDALTGKQSRDSTRESFRKLLRAGALDDRDIEIEVPERSKGNLNLDPSTGTVPMNEIILRFDKMMHGRKVEKRKMSVAESRNILDETVVDKVINEDDVKRLAIHSVEQEGIVFIDEIDKICSKGDFRSADASAEGVQRDLLPLIEGSTISTKHGNVNTDHILFICSGAFHFCKPSDLLAELQGRLPIRVELQQLTEGDFVRILMEPENNLLRQQTALMATEELEVTFTEEATRKVAEVAVQVNREVENIGARRLHTIIEKIMEEFSFDASEMGGQTLTIDVGHVEGAVSEVLVKTDLSKFIL